MPDPRDDVYGLACVAYELFAGKHPFNSNTALEALAAGLKPAPIPRLDARSWDALVRGLALRREQRTTSVAAFLAGLGVKGHERLRRDGDGDGSEPASATPTEFYDSDVRIVEPDAFAPTARPVAVTRAESARSMDVDDRYELFKIRRDDAPRRSARWLAWGAVLALGVSAAVYWDVAGLQERGTEWLAAGRGLLDQVAQSKLKASADGPSGSAAVPADDASRAQSPRGADAPPAGSPPPPSSAPTPTRSAPAAASSAPESANGVAPSAAAPAPKQAATPPKPIGPQSAATADASPSRVTQAQPTAPAAEPPMPETFEPEQPVATVSAAAPSAAITIRRHGGADGSTTFVWWTSDGTAIADEDYINLGARIEKLAAGEQTRTIHVPIIHDPKRRGQGTFYVNVRPGQGKREDPAQRVEVVLSR
jgi:hypothetical protein